MTQSNEDTKRTPCVARQPAGYSETWYVERPDGQLVAHHGDMTAEGERAETMLAHDLDDDLAVIHTVSPDDLPETVQQVATDGGERNE